MKHFKVASKKATPYSPAIETSDGFYPVFEPVICVQKGVIVGAELLCRHTRKKFPNTLEQWRHWYAHLYHIDYFFQYWFSSNPYMKNIEWISVNVDTEHLLDLKTYANIKKICEKFLNFKTILVLEWTEHLHNSQGEAYSEDDKLAASQRLDYLRQHYPIKIALDDAGSGLDTLRRIAWIHPDIIKIDGKLFKESCRDSRVFDILKMHLKLYKESSDVVIEWVEDTEDLFIIESLENELYCDEKRPLKMHRASQILGQGFFYNTVLF